VVFAGQGDIIAAGNGQVLGDIGQFCVGGLVDKGFVVIQPLFIQCALDIEGTVPFRKHVSSFGGDFQSPAADNRGV